MEINNEISLHKPLLFPQTFADEDPMGYLIRLSEINEYESFLWLINREKNIHSFSMPTLKFMYPRLMETHWTKGCKMMSIVEEICHLSPRLFIDSKLKYCPLCLHENKYYYIQWRLKVSTVCLKHRILLHDQCPECHSAVKFIKNSVGRCQCGAHLSSAPHVPASASLLKLQHFIEYGDIAPLSQTNRLTGRLKNKLNLRERIDLLRFFVRWSPTYIKRKNIQDNHSFVFGQLFSVRNYLQEVTRILFHGVDEFYGYLHTLNTLPPECIRKEELFVRFYRTFYKRYPQDFFQPYKSIIERYIAKEWYRPISRRNSLFNDSVRIDHPWISLKQACYEFKVHPFILKRAIKDNLIEVTDNQKAKRRFRLLYRPSIEKNIEILRRNVTFSEALKYLGITKNQLRELLAANHFPSAISPKEGYSQSWQFPQDVIETYLNKLFRYIQSTEKETVSVAEAMRIIGNRVENPLPKLIRAVLAKTLPVVIVNLNYRNIKGLGVPAEALKTWVNSFTISDPEYITIPEIAEKLKINQEFAYQLINHGLIEYELMGNTRFISQMHLKAFHEEYILLSHYTKEKGLNSRYLVNRLTEQGIFSVDHEWDKKLRQKVYRKQDF